MQISKVSMSLQLVTQDILLTKRGGVLPLFQ